MVAVNAHLTVQLHISQSGMRQCWSEYVLHASSLLSAAAAAGAAGGGGGCW